MAEIALAARDPFADALPPGRLGSLAGAPGVLARAVPPRGAAMVLARPGAVAALAEALRGLGLVLPGPRRSTASAEWHALAVGPERWLVFGPDAAAATLRAHLGEAAAVVDQSDARAVLSLRGPRARDALARLVAIDLHPGAFRVGDVAATQAGHIGCLLWQADDAPTFGLAVARGYAGSLAHWLLEATAEFGLLVEG